MHIRQIRNFFKQDERSGDNYVIEPNKGYGGSAKITIGGTKVNLETKELISFINDLTLASLYIQGKLEDKE